jgi:hypothetical protein
MKTTMKWWKRKGIFYRPALEEAPWERDKGSGGVKL